MRTVRTVFLSLGLGCLLIAGCSSDDGSDQAPPVDPQPSPATDPATYHGFFHEEDVKDIFADGNQLPPTISARMHACGKISYDALGAMLATRGVNLNVDPNAIPPGDPRRNTAGFLYRDGRLTLGAPTYDARVGEALRSTTGGVTRLLDVLVAAAQEIIDSMPAQAACKVNGVGARLFDDQGACNADGITCLLGVQAPADMVSLCNDMVKRAKDKTIGKRLAVAAMASSMYLCD